MNSFFEKPSLGLFIHWGLYAIPAWHEQIQMLKSIPKDQYVLYAEQFNPFNFDPDDWLDIAADAGMSYICFVTKHHDGFCLWDTKYSDYQIMNSPYAKDILAELAQACERRGFDLCLYYSIPDWFHPNSINAGGDHQLAQPNPGDQPDLDKYVDYVRNQVRELCSNYGPIQAFFWDIPPKHHDPSLNLLIRELQPGIMINDRGFDAGDFYTPERFVPKTKCFARPTEANQSVGQQSWGYRLDEDYFSHKFLMQSIDSIMAMGGNYLLNVGPKADGSFPGEACASLRAIGAWFSKVKAALVYAKPASEILDRENIFVTRHANTLYIHLTQDNCSSGLSLDPINSLPKSATILNTGTGLISTVQALPSMCTPWNNKPPCLHLAGIPVNDLCGEVIIIELIFDNLDLALESAKLYPA